MGDAIKKVIRVSKKPKKRVMKIKRIQSNTHKIKIYCAKKFYEQYLKDNEKPIDLISKIKFDVCQIEHLFKYNPDCLSNENLTAILTSNVDLDMILGIIFEHGQGKLKSMGIYDSCLIIMDKLYYMVNRVVKEFGIELDCKYGPDEMRFKIQIMRFGAATTRSKLNRMVVMKNNVIIETSNMIVPHAMLKGSNIMVEYLPNRFINIPYTFYKKLYYIENLNIHVQVAEDSNEDVADSYTDGMMSLGEQDAGVYAEEPFLFLDTMFESTGIYGHLSNMMRYIGLWDAFDQLTVELGSPYIPYKESINVKCKGREQTLDVPNFISEYFDFL